MLIKQAIFDFAKKQKKKVKIRKAMKTQKVIPLTCFISKHFAASVKQQIVNQKYNQNNILHPNLLQKS